ncbi:protein lunapark-like [Limulus polyphemus]|uniref:Endoplasmic reticulum junction formation protein lunapark n=1 Tax=Limulus polyphemus TaxID=6850 RepID=A0ABM1BGP6_LIMPO|nr:protein lunapark-like [Limulus polyphemus]
MLLRETIMGSVLMKFKKKPSTKQVLEELEKEIQTTSEYKSSSEKTHKHLIGSLILYSVLIYVVAALVYYFWFFPSTLGDGVLHSLPLLAFPLLVWILKRFLHWYFTRTIKINEEKLIELRKKKKSILDEVMEKETYKVAKELLEKFDPQLLKKQENTEEKTAQNGSRESTPLKQKETEVRQRTKRIPEVGQPRENIKIPGVVYPPVTPYVSGFIQNPVVSQRNRQWGVRPTGPAMPTPVLPQQRNMLDRFIDYMVGDGPSNRYALICQRCNSHNGMALKEEFEYIVFRCCYCFQLNPSRKQRPQSVKIAETQPSSEIPDHKSSDVSDGVEEIEEKTEPHDSTREYSSTLRGNEDNRKVVEELLVPTTNEDSQENQNISTNGHE